MSKSTRKSYDLEFKRRVVSEYISSGRSAAEIAKAEGLETGHIYSWKTQLEQRDRLEKIESLVDEKTSLDQARKIVELEEELEAYKLKNAEQAMIIDLLKKLHPNSPYAKKSSGYIDIKRSLNRKDRRAK